VEPPLGGIPAPARAVTVTRFVTVTGGAVFGAAETVRVTGGVVVVLVTVVVAVHGAGAARGAAVWLAPPADAEPMAIPPTAAIGSMKRSFRYHGREGTGS